MDRFSLVWNQRLCVAVGPVSVPFMAIQDHYATVADQATPPFAARTGERQPSRTPRIAPWLQGRERSLLRRLVNQVARPGVVSLAGGLPAVELFPSQAYGEVVRRLLADPQSMQYVPSCGELKEHVVEVMRRRGVDCGVEEILITTGAQQALDVTVRAFVSVGESVAVERYTYAGFREVLAPLRSRLVTLPTSLDDGLDVEALERCLLAGARPRLVYVIPDAHNPLGVSLAREAREQLVALAHDYDFVILEDDPYGLLCCDGEFEPPLAALDAERVVYAGTFSKILAPALRLGWLRLPASLVETFAAVKEIEDLECSGLSVLAVARLLDELDFDRHLELLRATYRGRRNAMLEALSEHLPEGCTFTEPGAACSCGWNCPRGRTGSNCSGGPWPSGRSPSFPAAAFAAGEDSAAPRNAARLSFSRLEPEALREAVAGFAACI